MNASKREIQIAALHFKSVVVFVTSPCIERRNALGKKPVRPCAVVARATGISKESVGWKTRDNFHTCDRSQAHTFV